MVALIITIIADEDMLNSDERGNRSLIADKLPIYSRLGRLPVLGPYILHVAACAG